LKPFRNPNDCSLPAISPERQNAARVEHVQGLLLPLSPRQVCDHLRLNWRAAARLHKAGLLSFDPATTEKLDERQEVELRFLGALVAAGCDHAMLTRLLGAFAACIPPPACGSLGGWNPAFLNCCRR
jgi:hypothetical protein